MATSAHPALPAGSEAERRRWRGLQALVSRAISIDPRETELAVRGFAPCSAEVRAALEEHGRSFVHGFNSSTRARDEDELEASLEAVAAPERGFAFEGAAMGLALLDLVLPRRRLRFAAFVRGPAVPHVYMAHVGAGWALARLRRRPSRRLGLDPLLRWLAFDGYGFHEAFFHPQRAVREGRRPRRLRGYELRVFDQGLGRALWFVETADPNRIAATVDSFAPERRADVWSGVGLAATYAGAIDEDGLKRLAELARPFRAHLAQGAAFAAKARLRAGNPVPHVERACAVLCAAGAEEAAAVTDGALASAAGSYERWRAEIRAAFGAA